MLKYHQLQCMPPHTIIKKGNVTMAPSFKREKLYTIDDIYGLPAAAGQD